jgi:uncharacterized membrane protein YcaP (DUF421 family)
VAGAQYANEWLSYWDHGFDALLEGTPTRVVQNGVLDVKGMRAERMNAKEVMAELRGQGIEDIREVKQAMVETDGMISVIREDWAEPVRRADLAGEAETSEKGAR